MFEFKFAGSNNKEKNNSVLIAIIVCLSRES